MRCLMTKKFKRLFIDIETSPNVVFSWRIGYKISLSPENIIHERKIIMASWKWEGSSKVHNITWDKNQDDKRVVEKVIEALNEADEIVYQNGDRFDLPWIKTRAIYHGLPMYPKYNTFDTLKKVRSNFYFNSNQLGYVQEYLGGEGKLEHGGFSTWKNICLDNCKKSLRLMRDYCDKDVIELEEFYNKIVSYVTHNTHVGVQQGLEKWSCPHCAGTDIRTSKTKYSAAGAVRKQMQCKSCNGYYTISEASHKAWKKVKDIV